MESKLFKSWVVLLIFVALSYAGLVNLPTPQISPEEYRFTRRIAVSIHKVCEDSLAKNTILLYTVDGSSPVESNSRRVYTTPFFVTKNTTVKAVLVSADNPSLFGPVATSRFYKISQLPVPSVKYSLQDNSYHLYCDGFENDSDIVIFYTMDNSNPVIFGTKYTKPLILDSSAILKMFAVSKMGTYLNSPITVKKGIVRSTFFPAPFILPEDCSFLDSLVVTVGTFSDIAGTKILYTSNGSDPDTSSKPYTRPLVIRESTNFKAALFSEGKRVSLVADRHFVKSLKKMLKKPVVTWERIGDWDSVIISFENCRDASILYTLDGSEPDYGSFFWDKKPLHLKMPINIKAKAVKIGYEPGPVSSLTLGKERWFDITCDRADGTLFSDSLAVKLRCNGSSSYKILYTIDGTDPVTTGKVDTGSVVIRKSAIVKAVVISDGKIASRIVSFRFYKIASVSRAEYYCGEKSLSVDSVRLFFDSKINNTPSLLEIIYPDNAGNRVFYTPSSVKLRSDSILTVVTSQKVSSPLSKNIKLRGRIPMSGDFDTSPFQIVFSDVKNRTSGIVVVSNPFTPLKTELPESIMVEDMFRHTYGTAIIVSTVLRSRGEISIYDAYGNTIISRCRMEVSEDGYRLIYVWDGLKEDGNTFSTGSYLAIVTCTELQSGRTDMLKTTIMLKNN